MSGLREHLALTLADAQAHVTRSAGMLQSASHMGRSDLRDFGHVREETWNLCDSAFEQLTHDLAVLERLEEVGRHG